MLSPEERAYALDIADRLIELEAREAALDDGDLDRVYDIQAQIDAKNAERRQVLAHSER